MGLPYFCSVLMILFCLSVTAQDMTKAEYILQYQDIAISEMDRSGIPASITLAQGILESRYGNSDLAVEANNHFGIKCHRGWTGRSYYLEDDDRDSQGRLIKSCFRVYSSAEQSYLDHSEFLMNRERYAGLFEYDKYDYKSWSHGLKAAGYATNPQYGNILIRIIEENNLARFDRMTSRVPVYNLPEKDDSGNIVIAPPQAEDEVIFEEDDDIAEIPEFGDPPPKPVAKKKLPGIYRVNDVKAVRAGEEDTPLSMARQLNMSLSRLMKYNDLSLGDDLIPGQNVFLQPKRKKSRGRKSSHRVEKGETMYSISQDYGVKLKHLYKRNNLNHLTALEPESGQRIYLRGSTTRKPKTKPADFRSPPRYLQDTNRDDLAAATTSVPPIVEEQPEPESSLPNPEGYHLIPPMSRPAESKPEPTRFNPESANTSIPVTRQPQPEEEELESGVIVMEPEPVSEEITIIAPSAIQSATHEVVAGDTLYSISRRYNIDLGDLKRKNGLTSNLIKIGQVLEVD
ncbi:MAG: glucosaminidase domain-containing protein [Bacteroidota bacterium]